MTDYNDGNWHGWNGGECPVHPKSWVEWIPMQENIIYGNPSEYSKAKDIPWSLLPGDKYYVVAFNVREPYREPREGYIASTIFATAREAKIAYPGCNPIKVREVIE
jgi:hypothetical protein